MAPHIILRIATAIAVAVLGVLMLVANSGVG
jgi:hypothetical protein